MNFDEFDFELDTLHPTRQARRPTPPRRSPPPKPAPPPALTAKDVQIATIDVPAQESLLRLSADLATRAKAAELLAHVKAGRIASIRCQRSAAAEARAKRLGYSAANAIRPGEDAVVLLDPNDLRSGPPIIAVRHDLDARCSNARAKAPGTAEQKKIDAALLKALDSFELWRGGISLGRSGKCALVPLDDASKTVRADALGKMKVLGNMLPRMLCQKTAVAATPRTPKLVRHRHVSFNCNTTFKFVPDGPATDLVTANMNPRFIMPDDSISVHAPLNDKLRELITKKFPTLINASSAKSGKAEPTDAVHIAVVDLSGDRKLCQPQLATFGAEFNEAGASTSKILLFYAAHQLHFDLEQMVTTNGIRTIADLKKKANEEWAVFTCKPDIDWAFKFTPPSGAGGLLKVEKSDALNTTMANIVDEVQSTPRATRLILRLSFEYIASLAWQSGLRHPTRGGLWYGSTYCTMENRDPRNGRCHTLLADGTGGCPKKFSRVTWNSDPLSIQGVKGSALSFATYMTLLAQGRLVDNTNSTAIKALLKRACGVVKWRVTGVTANKCGDTEGSLHDAVLIERGTKIRYVIGFTVRSKSKSDPVRNRFRDMLPEIDQLIVDANP